MRSKWLSAPKVETIAFVLLLALPTLWWFGPFLGLVRQSPTLAGVLFWYSWPFILPLIIAWSIRCATWLAVFAALVVIGALVFFVLTGDRISWKLWSLTMPLIGLVAGAVIGALSRAVGLRLARRHSSLVVWTAQMLAAIALGALGIWLSRAPSMWAARTPAADCYKATAHVSLAGSVYRLPLLAPFHVGWVGNTSEGYDFEKPVGLNAFCALRSQEPIAVGVIGLFLPKLETNEYGPGEPVERDVAKKKQDFCDATRGQHWRDPLCERQAQAPAFSVRQILLSETISAWANRTGRGRFNTEPDERGCGHNAGCMFDQAWYDIAEAAPKTSPDAPSALPLTFVEKRRGDRPGIQRIYERTAYNGFVVYTTTTTAPVEEGGWTLVHIFLELTRVQDFEGRNVVFRCFDAGKRDGEQVWSCTTSYRLEKELSVQYDLVSSQPAFGETGAAADATVRMMLKELRKAPPTATP